MTPASNLSDEDIDAAYQEVWSTVTHAKRLVAFARAIEAKVLDRARATAEPVEAAERNTWLRGAMQLIDDYADHFAESQRGKELDYADVIVLGGMRRKIRAALAVGTEIPPKHSDHQVESTGTPTGAVSGGRA